MPNGQIAEDGTFQVTVTSKRFGERVILLDYSHSTLLKKRKLSLMDNGKGVPYVKILPENVLLHRFIMRCPKGLTVDHKNRNTLDNRRSNLRIASYSQNLCNRRDFRNKKYRGVTMKTGVDGRKTWRANVIVDGRKHYFGTFLTEIDAARAYDVAAKKLHGEFAWLNFPNAHAESPKPISRHEASITGGPKKGRKYKGVFISGGGRFFAKIAKDGRQFRLGTFDDEESAAKAYDKEAKKLFGNRAYVNFP